MINTAMKTRNWSPAEQKPSFGRDETQFVTPGQREANMDNKDVGAILNSVADPNFVEKSDVKRAPKSELGKDAFFKLMLAQIKNQDPTSPMQSHEMAAHLAQFTSLEQLYNVNENLASLKRGQDPMANYQALNFIGKSVSADSSQIVRTKGDTKHEVHYELPVDAQSVEVAISDASGTEVRKLKFNNVKKGDVRFSWNGLAEDGNVVSAGDYNVKIEALDANNKKVAVKTNFSGKVTGVNFAGGTPILLMGEQSIKLSDIKRIEDDEMKSHENGTAAPVKSKEVEVPPTPSPTQSKQGDVKRVTHLGDKQAGPAASAAVKSDLRDMVNRMTSAQKQVQAESREKEASGDAT